MKIGKISCFEVIVPARKGSIDSKEVHKPLHKLPIGAQAGWKTQFDKLSKLIIKIETTAGAIGWGELYRGHSPNVVEDIIALLLGKDLQTLCLQKLPFVFCREYDGFECAIWDAYAKEKQMRLVDLLGGPVREQVRVGAWSSHRTIEEVGEVVKNFSAAGYDCVKFKCDLQDDVVGWCRIIREVAPEMQVLLDPNERWEYGYETKKRVEALKEIGNVLCLEDPIPRWKLQEYAELRQFSAIPVVLHVSLPYLLHGQRIQDTIRAIQLNAVDGFNFNGGLADFQRMEHVAAAAELPCFHGSEVDLGILEAMYVHSAAASQSCIWPSDIFGRLIREHDLLVEPLVIKDSFVQLPQGHGLGVEVDEKSIKNYQISFKEYSL